MNNDHVSSADLRLSPANAPRKLHKPHREISDLEIEQVVTYASDGDSCSESAAELGEGGAPG